jgi:hypothetical protein
MFMRSLVIIALLVALFETATVPIARAEMIVMESNAPQFPTGLRLPDGTVLALPAGGRVRVLLSSQETKVFIGASAQSSRAFDPYGGTRGSRREPIESQH